MLSMPAEYTVRDDLGRQCDFIAQRRKKRVPEWIVFVHAEHARNADFTSCTASASLKDA